MFARTERLLLRPGWPEDAPALACAIGEEAIVRNLAHAPWPYALADAEAFLGAESGALPRFLIFARTDAAPRLIGGIALLGDESGDVALGYWIRRACWGQGFATEAGRAVVALAHRGLRIDRLVADHFRDNPASGRVLRKLGFHPTGVIAPRASPARERASPAVLFARDAADAVAEVPRSHAMAA